MRISLVSALFAFGCGSTHGGLTAVDTGPEELDTATETKGTSTGDLDGDGFSEDAGDCDDLDASAYPGALEICDGVDNDCNGLSDELAAAATLDSNTNYGTIQEALDAAIGGSTIVVCDGTWGGAIKIETTVTLSSVSGQFDCTIDGQSQDSTITVTAPDVVISGLTVTGGLGAAGGGINGVAADRLKVEASIITLNSADFGAGVYLGDHCELTDTIVTQNQAIEYGGGVAVKAASTATITNGTIEANNAKLGGGAFLYEGATLTASGTSTFSDNVAESGGGVYVWAGAFSGGELEGNDAIYGGGLYFFAGGQVTDLVVAGNTSEHGGGAVIHGAATLTDVVLSGNDATIEGGGLFVDDGSVTCDGSTRIDDNTTDDDGAGAVVWNGAITACEFNDNHANDSAGGIAGLGDFTLTDVILRDNSSDVRAGGIYANGPVIGDITGGEIVGNTSVSWGGALYANNGADVTIDGTPITGNVSDFGAGIYINQGSSVAISNSFVEDNGDIATTTGGGARIANGSLTSTNTGWGAEPLDNTPDDVVAGAGGVVYIGYEAGETFTCDELACDPVP